MADLDPVITKLRERRLARRMTQRQVAELSGLGRATISDSEYGRYSPTLDTLRKWAAALDLDLTTVAVQRRDGRPDLPEVIEQRRLDLVEALSSNVRRRAS